MLNMSSNTGRLCSPAVCWVIAWQRVRRDGVSIFFLLSSLTIVYCIHRLFPLLNPESDGKLTLALLCKFASFLNLLLL